MLITDKIEKSSSDLKLNMKEQKQNCIIFGTKVTNFLAKEK